MRLANKSVGALFWLCISVSLMLGSCSKRERSLVGISQYPDSLLLNPDTLTLDSLVLDSTYHHFIPTGSSRTLLLGFEGEYEAWTLFRFECELIEYDSARIHLPPADDSVSVGLEFGIHRISGEWDDTSVEWPFQWYEPTPLIQAAISPSETLIVIDCPAPETVVSGEDTTLSWNLLFIPTAGGMAKLSSTESVTRPAIRLYKDTITTSAYPAIDAYVIYHPDVDTSLLWVGGGWVLRSDLTFDISKLPANSIISRAELTLQVCNPSTEWMEIIAFIPDAGRSAAGYLDTDSTSIAILLTDLVQYWISSENTGFTLKTTDETAEISRVSFFSSDSLDKKPTIRIIYTERVYED